MRIATLQFNPLLGDVHGNIQKADSLLELYKDKVKELDLLVLPELAFTGYNHKSLAAIQPYLESTSTGPSTLWAQNTARSLQTSVAVGYPEKEVLCNECRAYNSLVFVDSSGDVVAHTRKTFLYYTDETWASEGQGFFDGEVPLGSNISKTPRRLAAGICMDINPYRFEAPWTAYEFANHVLASRAELVVLSTAWITRQSGEELQDQAALPDLETVGYWLERMRPLMGPNDCDHEVVVVLANRCGQESDPPSVEPVRYAGSSTVLGIRRGEGQVVGEVRVWDMLGRGTEGVLIVDTHGLPKYGLKRKPGRDGPDSSGS